MPNPPKLNQPCISAKHKNTRTTPGGPPVEHAPYVIGACTPGGGVPGTTDDTHENCTGGLRPVRPRFELLLEATHDPTDVDGSRRLRGALKRLLRSFGLRCTRVEPVTKPVNTAMPRGAANRADTACDAGPGGKAAFCLEKRNDL